jgi:hypothetical protein
MKENPELWSAAWRAGDAAVYASRDKAWNVAWYAARNAAWAAVRDTARDAAWYAAENAARDAAWGALTEAGWDAAGDEAAVYVADAAIALVAYDDCDQYLALGYEKLRVYAILSGKPQAILLLPMSYVREKINEPALV